MAHVRCIPLAVAFAAVTVLTACSTAPAMPMGGATAHSMAAPDHMARMDMQTRTMQEMHEKMHEKMMNAKTPEERSKLMAEHMKSMQDGMKMMDCMPAASAR